MSMLTPPGMGGKYRITGDKYPRMRPPRRRGRLVFGLVASVAALGLIGWGTFQLIDVFSGGRKTSAAGTGAGCPSGARPSASPVALPVPAKITVNVYNATPRGGLAKSTADELKKRGFKIGDVGNATTEYDKKIKGAGILIGPTTSLNSSLPVLGAQLADAERRTDVARKSTALDLIIGDAFKSLTAKADADKTLTALTSPATPAGASKKCGRTS